MKFSIYLKRCVFVMDCKQHCGKSTNSIQSPYTQGSLVLNDLIQPCRGYVVIPLVHELISTIKSLEVFVNFEKQKEMDEISRIKFVLV